MSGARRLPGGKVARTMAEHREQWSALVAPLKRALGWQLLAYDPDVRVDANGSTLTLTVAQAQAIAQLVERAEGA